MDKLLDVRELAKLLGVAEGSIYHWISQGRLPVVRFSKRCVRFRESDLQALLDSLEVGEVGEKQADLARRFDSDELSEIRTMRNAGHSVRSLAIRAWRLRRRQSLRSRAA